MTTEQTTTMQRTTALTRPNHYNQSLAEVLVCKNCRHWHKDKESDAVLDDAAWGECDIIECGSYGSDSICTDFEEKD